jgi:preprotein translocase subunit SecG
MVVSGWLSSSWVVVIVVVIIIVVVVVVVVVVVCDGSGDDVGDMAACSGIEAQMPRCWH